MLSSVESNQQEPLTCLHMVELVCFLHPGESIICICVCVSVCVHVWKRSWLWGCVITMCLGAWSRQLVNLPSFLLSPQTKQTEAICCACKRALTHTCTHTCVSKYPHLHLQPCTWKLSSGFFLSELLSCACTSPEALSFKEDGSFITFWSLTRVHTHQLWGFIYPLGRML